MNSKRFGITSVIILVVLLFFAIGVPLKVMMDTRNKNNKTLESDFTPEQKSVLSALNSARAELEQTKNDIAKSKAELTDMIANARASILTVAPNAGNITWLIQGHYGNQETYIMANNKPILWGFRSDGVVLWKGQP